MSNALLSIIIPVYKVEAYLDECVQSVCHQTYQNLEIILVDDGSPDACPDMCDRYAKYDTRIKVIHKKNGGLSDARNAGLEIATGDYIGFVDSDDCIDEKMYETLLHKIESYRTDIVSCKFVNYGKGNFLSNNVDIQNGYSEGLTLTFKEYFAWVVEGKLDNASWNKLYRKQILTERFKKGRNNEDYLFFAQLAKNNPNATISFIDGSYYKYRQQREGSICTDNVRLWIDNYVNRKEILEDINLWNPELKEILQEQNEKLLFGIIYELCTDSKKREKNKVAFLKLHKAFCRLPFSKIDANKVDVAIMKYLPFIYKTFVNLRLKIKN